MRSYFFLINLKINSKAFKKIDILIKIIKAENLLKKMLLRKLQINSVNYIPLVGIQSNVLTRGFSFVHNEETIKGKLNAELIPKMRINYHKMKPYEHKINYNSEQYPQYAKKVKQAIKQRNI